MFDRMIGQYLVKTRRLTVPQLLQVYEQQDKVRAKLGVIAVAEKLMSVAQAEEVNALQATQDRKFGDIAIEHGYLNEEQVRRLLELQGNEFHTFSQVIVDMGLMELDEVQAAVGSYQRAYKLLPRDMDALIAGDIDRIVAMHLDTDDEIYRGMFATAVRNMYRLVDRHLSISKSSKARSFDGEVMAYQQMTGDLTATVAVAGTYKDVRRTAIAYTQEEFIETKEDALDAMGELINTNNGLFATEYSARDKGSIELKPPGFFTEGAKIVAGRMHALPIHICGGTISYSIAIGDDVTFKS